MRAVAGHVRTLRGQRRAGGGLGCGRRHALRPPDAPRGLSHHWAHAPRGHCGARPHFGRQGARPGV
eukprot:5672668-Lingulodinium_polyedra.AAC.1